MPGPRNPDNIKLEDARRQFFQWHIVENRPISEVKQKMDLLSQELDKDFVAESVRVPLCQPGADITRGQRVEMGKPSSLLELFVADKLEVEKER